MRSIANLLLNGMSHVFAGESLEDLIATNQIDAIIDRITYEVLQAVQDVVELADEMGFQDEVRTTGRGDLFYSKRFLNSDSDAAFLIDNYLKLIGIADGLKNRSPQPAPRPSYREGYQAGARRRQQIIESVET